MNRPISEIVVRDRYRKELGDIAALAANIEELGLLQPIGIRPDGTLVEGGRRIEAFRLLGRLEIPVHVCHGLDDEVNYLKAQRDANEFRLEMAPSEKVRLGLDIEAQLKPEAELRKQEGQARGGRAEVGGGSPPTSRSKVRDDVGAAVGWGGKTWDQAKKVVLAANDEALPEAVRAVAQEAVKTMDATGKVQTAFRKAQAAGAIPGKKKNGKKPPARKPQEDFVPNERQLQFIAAFERRIATLSGMCSAIAEIKVPSMSPEQAQRNVGLLQDAVAKIHTLRRKVSEQCAR